MKKYLVLLVVVFTATVASAQKYGYIYSKKVFDEIPQYKTAVKSIEQYAEQKQELVDNLQREISVLYEEFSEYSYQMSTSQRTRYQTLITEKEKTASEMETKLFSSGGEVEARQKELMGPVERIVIDAVNRVAERDGYDMIFDMSLMKVTIYQSPRADLTEVVIKELRK